MKDKKDQKVLDELEDMEEMGRVISLPPSFKVKVKKKTKKGPQKMRRGQMEKL